jgi:ComF family protein
MLLRRSVVNKALTAVRNLIVDKPIALFKYLDLSSYLCEEKCRACGRSVLEDPSNSEHSDCEFESRSNRFCLCFECHAKFLRSRQSLWWLPIPDRVNKGTEVLSRKDGNTTFDTTKFLPVATAAMYEGVMQKLVRKLKYDDDRLVVRDMNVLMQKAFFKLQSEVDAFRNGHDVLIVPIPLHKSRERKRGYNQATLLAKGVGERNKLPVNCDVLKRVKKTKPQFGLNKQERLANIDGAFSLGRTDVSGKSIILIDDVFTSGATLTLCAKLLTTGGASKVAAIAAARAPYDR